MKVKALSLVGAAVLAISGCGTGAGAETAEDYPSRDIEILVGFGAGGGSDVFARKVAEIVKENHDINTRVVNLEGAGGSNAIREVANRPSDGYTWVADGALAALTAFGQFDEGLDALQPVARFQSDVSHILVDPERYSDFESLKEESEDGTINIGGVGAAGPVEAIALDFFESADLDASYVPYDSAGEVIAGIQGGSLHAAMEELGAAADYVESGDLKSVLSMTDERLAELPDIPSSVELGIDTTDGVERGIHVHPETDPEIVAAIETILSDVYESENYQEYEVQSHLHHRDGWLGADDYQEAINTSADRYAEVIGD